MNAISFVRMPRADSGFAAVLTFLAAREPFRAMPLGPIAESVAGAVKRGHYILAVMDKRVLGVTCWALCDFDTARSWTAGGAAPSYENSTAGDTVVLMLGGGDLPRIALQGVRHIAGLYPGRRYLMNRFGRHGTQAGRFPGRAPR